MLDIFKPLPAADRRANLAAYHQFLIARDGAMDVEKRPLSRREERMAKYERLLSRIRHMDRDLFTAQYEAFNSKVETPPETLLLIALVKINGAEAFGVNQSFDKVLRRAVKNDDMCELMLLIEETYHTRILLSTALSYGVEVKSAYAPPASIRTLISAIGLQPAGHRASAHAGRGGSRRFAPLSQFAREDPRRPQARPRAPATRSKSG